MAQNEWGKLLADLEDMRHTATMLPRDWRGRVCIDPGALDNIIQCAITMADTLDKKARR